MGRGLPAVTPIEDLVFMSGPTLAQRFDPRHNSLPTLRIALAAIVGAVHAQDIGWGDQPSLGRTQLGELAVDAFFVISGFLVTRSSIRLRSFGRFLWHRALRIFPGFWMCLILMAFVVAPVIALLQGRSAAVVLTDDASSQRFVWRNAALLIRQWDIAGLHSTSSEPAINGSLWTLYYEALCYVMIGLMAMVGVLRHPLSRSTQALSAAERVTDLVGRHLYLTRWLPSPLRKYPLIAVTAGTWLLHVLQASGALPAAGAIPVRFMLLFLLGALGHLYAHRVRFTPLLLAGAAISLAISLVCFVEYRPLGAAPFAYLFLWAIVGLPLRANPSTDLSYGVYIYHWPIFQVLSHSGATTAGRIAFTTVGLLITALIAAASWRYIEAPALRHKSTNWIRRGGARRMATHLG